MKSQRKKIPAVVEKTAKHQQAEKEVAKTSLYSWKRTLEGHRRHVSDLIKDGAEKQGSNVWRALQEEIRDLDNSIRTLEEAKDSGVDAPGSPRRTFEVLRTALAETQKRCESLNVDMGAQQDSNNALVGALQTGKNTNKDLLDQIQQQTGKITSLTQVFVSLLPSLNALQPKLR